MYKTLSKNCLRFNNRFTNYGKNRGKQLNSSESAKHKQIKKIQALKINQIIEGKVIKIEDRWAIVEFDGIQGFLHLSEISTDWLTHPSEALSLNMIVKAKIISKKITKDRNHKVSLSTIDYLKIKA